MNIFVALLGLFLFEVAPFNLHLSVDGDTFYPREPIYSRLVIVNVSNKVQKLPDVRKYAESLDFLTYEIMNNNGGTIPKSGAQITYRLSDERLLRLNPGDSVVFIMSLDEEYGIGQKDEDGHWVATWTIPPGSYKVIVIYEFMQKNWPRLKLWRGSVKSNEVNFVVRELPEDLKRPYYLYCKIITLLQWRKYQGEYLDTNEARKLAEEFINIYFSESKSGHYNPLVQIQLARLYGQYISFEGRNDYIDTRISAWKNLFEEYPGSKLAKYRLSFMKRIFEKSDRINEWLPYLEHLSEKYPKTLVGDEAKELLRKEKQLEK